VTPMHFHIPVLPDILARPRLIHLLKTHGHCRIVLITGQAAQGKSTMAADYLNREAAPSLWFHLTPAASDSGVFFDLMTSGLKQLAKSGQSSFSLPHVSLGTRQDLSRQAEMLISSLNRMATPVNLVLDDMEALGSDAPALALIQTLLADSPPGVRFFLLSRTMPALNLSRFKMRQTLLELTNDDLAFTLEETLAFFKDAAGADQMDQKAVEKVLAVTNGWAGGLVLVSESVRRAKGLQGLPEHLSAEVFSYFSQEIYRNLPEAIRTFLAEAALFEELDTRILSLVFPRTRPKEMLIELSDRNLFIQKIISHSQWPVFKFNNLFREFLLAELSMVIDDDRRQALNQRIGEVFWEEKDHEKAIPFLMASGAHDMVARILKIKGADYVITARTDRLSRWIDSLPAQFVREDPWLIFFKTMAHRIRGGKKNIQAFNRALDLFRDQEDTRGILLSLAYLIEASIFIRRPSKEIRDRIRAGEQALAVLGGQYRFTWARTLLWQQIGLGYITGTGDIPKGISACRNAILLAQGIDNPSLVLSASVILTLGLVQSGDFVGARQMLEKTRALSQEDNQPEYRALEDITNIDLALKRGDTDRAGILLSRSEADIETFGLIFLYPGLVEARALYQASIGQFNQSIQAAEHLHDFSVLEGNDFYQGIAHRIKAMALLLKGEVEGAGAEAEKSVSELDRSRRGDIHLFLARQVYGAALYRMGQHRKACEELTPVLAYFKLIQSDLSYCETAFFLGLAACDSKDKSLAKKAGQFFLTGFEKALENQYRHFPLLDPEMMGEVLIRAWELGPGPEGPQFAWIQACAPAGALSAVVERLGTEEKKKRGPRNFSPLMRAACPRLSIATLGGFSVLRGGVPVSSFGGGKPLMLFKMLLIHGAADVPKEMLMEALWPDAGESAGEKNLKINLHRLRKALEPFAVKDFGHIYLLQKAGRISLAGDLVELDTQAFKTLVARGNTCETHGDNAGAMACYAEAVGLYRGDYFQDDPYLEAADQDREVFRRLCIDTLERMAAISGDQARFQQEVDAWRKILQIDSCHEGACRNLMILYKDAGMKTEALQVYSRCCQALERELDTEPDTRTQQIYDHLAKG